MCKVFEYRSNLFLYSFQNPFWFKTSFLIWEKKKNSKASPTLWFPHSYKWYHAIGANGSTSKNKVPTSFSTKYFSVFFPDDFKNLIYVGKPWQFSGFPCLFTHLKHLKCVACECPLCIYKASWKHCATSQQQILLNRDACSTSWEYTASSKTFFGTQIPTWSMQATSADILNQGTQCPVTKRTGVAVLILGKIRIKDNRGCVMF